MKKGKSHTTETAEQGPRGKPHRAQEQGTAEPLAPEDRGGHRDEGSAGPEAEAERSPDQIIHDLGQRIATLEDSLLRAKADYQNLLRRSANERSEAVRFANADLMRSLLVVLDDFERSLEAAQQTDHLESVVDGIRLVYQNLLKALQEHGLEPIEARDTPFDPNVHEALMRQPTPEQPPGTVVDEIARGYRLRDRVIRPAKVIVAQAPQEQAPAEGKEGSDQE